MDFPLYPVSKFVCANLVLGVMGLQICSSLLLVGRVCIFCVAIYEEAVVVAATRTVAREEGECCHME
jgi:hypothetical protein